MFQIKVVEEIKTHILCSITVVRKSRHFETLWKNIVELDTPQRRWEDNIRMDLQEVGLGYEDWIGLAQDRDRWRALASAVRNLRVP